MLQIKSIDQSNFANEIKQPIKCYKQNQPTNQILQLKSSIQSNVYLFGDFTDK
jgi:hypothetical protein